MVSNVFFMDEGFVYLIQDTKDEVYKIGITRRSVTKRLNQLLTASPRELVIIETFKSKHYRAIEGILHKHFKSKQTHREWFELTIDDADTFIEHCKGIENNLNILIEYGNFFHKP